MCLPLDNASSWDLLGPRGPRCPTNLCYACGAQGKLGKNFLNWGEYSPASLCLSLPPKRVQTLCFWVHLSLSTCCDTQVAPRVLYLGFRGLCLFWLPWKRFWGWFGPQLPLAKSWTSKPSAVSWCSSMPLWGCWGCHSGQPPGLKTWLSPPRALVVSSKGHLLPISVFLSWCQGFGCAREQRPVGAASRGGLSQ